MDKSTSASFVHGQDEVHQWVYEMSLWKNPTILMTVWFIFVIGALFPALLMFFLTLGDGFVAALEIFLQVEGLVVCIITVLLLIVYPVFVLFNGGKYCVVFTMDEKGILHSQMDKQFKKSQVLSMITLVAGALGGSPQTAGAGLLAGTKQSSYSSFDKVTRVKSRPKRHVIYVNASLNHNQVYASSADFPYVEAYIIAHATKAKIS